MSTRLCDGDGIVRSGPFHDGTDYPCTGSAHYSNGAEVICSNPVHTTTECGGTGLPVRVAGTTTQYAICSRCGQPVTPKVTPSRMTAEPHPEAGR